MDAKEAIRGSLARGLWMIKQFLADFSDEEILVRPVEGANHIAWQLGHLIASESMFVSGLGAASVELPEGFAEAHGKQAAPKNDGFQTKATYLELLAATNDAMLGWLESVDSAALDGPPPGSLAGLCDTLGDSAMLMADHRFMHAGQFSVVRRKLGKPHVF